MRKIITGFIISALLISGCATKEANSKSEEKTAQNTVEENTSPVIQPESDALYHKAAQAYGKGNHTEALQLANQALEKDEKNYKALSLKGIIIAFDISPDEGTLYIEKSLFIQPNYTQAFYDMAIAQKLGKHYDESIAYFEKVLKADPQNTWSYYGIATNWADKGNKEQALFYLEKAVRLGGKDVIDAAAVQDHFDRFRDDKDFQKILAE